MSGLTSTQLRGNGRGRRGVPIIHNLQIVLTNNTIKQQIIYYNKTTKLFYHFSSLFYQFF